MEIRDLNEKKDRLWADAMVKHHFGSTTVVSRGVAHDTTTLPALIALEEARPAGLLQYRIDGTDCEVVTLLVSQRGLGIGRTLMQVIQGVAARHGCKRIWLVTTNDNTDAQAFYRAIGWQQCAVHKGAVAAARALKPEIPETGPDGARIEDEIEFERVLVP